MMTENSVNADSKLFSRRDRDAHVEERRQRMLRQEAHASRVAAALAVQEALLAAQRKIQQLEDAALELEARAKRAVPRRRGWFWFRRSTEKRATSEEVAVAWKAVAVAQEAYKRLLDSWRTDSLSAGEVVAGTIEGAQFNVAIPTLRLVVSRGSEAK